ncbi:MAG: ferrous iron transport protein A [archaeon GB-1867-035]|nr:ferrous iron transport protein A [Candidatus Culexmicrobium profundum]
MIFRKRRIEKLIPCILEVLTIFKADKVKPSPELIAKRLGVSVDLVRDALKVAFERDLIKPDTYDLTNSGRALLIRHRESFLHDKYLHRFTLPWRDFSKFKDADDHLSLKHGLGSEGLTRLKVSLSSLTGRIEELKPLSSLSPGSRGVIEFTVGGYGLLRRLADMGLTPGTEVVIVRNAPFGGPIVIQVRGSSVALGRGVASKVFVRLIGD